MWSAKINASTRHEVPAHHNAENYVDAYIEAAGTLAIRRPPSSAPSTAAVRSPPTRCTASTPGG